MLSTRRRLQFEMTAIAAHRAYAPCQSRIGKSGKGIRGLPVAESLNVLPPAKQRSQ
ncbi:hypothetical protein ACVWXO_005453 [Bradyrhizobium sp. LM2.7]